jgi:diadenosine tetraphosphate (Ap4A) HIT family hydrolase
VCGGVVIVQNNGAAGGQVVFHVHFHVLPRWDGDGLVRLGKSGDMISKEAAAEVLQAMGVAAP